MTGASNLLGQTNASPVSDAEKSKEEEDQQERNTKKAKINNQSLSAIPVKVNSYKDMVTGGKEDQEDANRVLEEEG
jgi:hypothetical protein